MILLGIILAMVLFSPLLIRQIQEERRKEKLASQLRQALQTMVHALRIGVGFAQALEYAAQEGPMPLAGEWRRALQSVRLGRSLVEALKETAGRVSIKEMGWFVTAVEITQSTGGSLADVLESLSITLQEEQTLREKIGALTMQGKASGVLLSLLPFLMMGALEIVAPEIVSPLFVTSAGQAVIAGVLVSVAIGGIIIKKIVTIKVA